MAEVVILGSAQDGGVPHAGCLCANCRNARANSSVRRRPASLGIRSGDDWLIVDATLAFEEQMHMLWSRRPSSLGYATERYRPPETIIVTHAHSGHYNGLWQLDKSVLAAPNVNVLAPPRTAELLRQNEPWSAMIRDGYISVESLAWNELLEPIEGVKLLSIEVPHRSEWETDTAALVIEGASSDVLYLSDIDFWDEWDRYVENVVEDVDIAILDGSFWDAPTSPDVPHPPIRETMDRLQGVAERGRTRIIFTHLNHSNPVVSVDSLERSELEARGFEIAEDGMALEI
jgi:pyrroloquinoline quinone biosynthesis protein B